MSLKGKVALVTGASRGIGRGIALQLGEAQATVYVTGRKPEDYDEATKLFKVSTLHSVADEITQRGGKGIAVFVDHSDGKSVKALFDRISEEQNGQLDILVNNAYAGVPFIFTNTGKKFYEFDPEYSYDIINNVGLRNHYICSSYAARLMIPRKSGLIVVVSSMGGMNYLFNVSYGLGKAACDKLAADMAVELRGTGVSAVSLWPGAVKTEIINQGVLNNPGAPEISKQIFSNGESTEFSGKTIVALANDPELEKLSGRILKTATLAKKYDIYDLDGSQPNDRGFSEEYIQVLNKVRVDDTGRRPN
ncbi:hypothetical protein FO519_001003 [Halicephalobus sp. NKZ332]|nr:hypothetical protein FO519_001003 [Halicephalobus sp. NKZ332]